LPDAIWDESSNELVWWMTNIGSGGTSVGGRCRGLLLSLSSRVCGSGGKFPGPLDVKQARLMRWVTGPPPELGDMFKDVGNNHAKRFSGLVWVGVLRGVDAVEWFWFGVSLGVIVALGLRWVSFVGVSILGLPFPCFWMRYCRYRSHGNHWAGLWARGLWFLHKCLVLSLMAIWKKGFLPASPIHCNLDNAGLYRATMTEGLLFPIDPVL